MRRLLIWLAVLAILLAGLLLILLGFVPVLVGVVVRMQLQAFEVEHRRLLSLDACLFKNQVLEFVFGV